MPLQNYKLLIGKVRGLQLDDDSSPHIEVLVHANGTPYRIAVNVRSSVQPHDLLYRRFDAFDGPTLPLLERLTEDGVVDVRGSRPDLAFDYVADDLFERDTMAIAPYEAHGPANDLKEFLIPLLQSAIGDDSRVFAFGEMFGPESAPDPYFKFRPGQGIHDIHMNQGDSGAFASTNGPKQDGALLLRHPSGTWTALFLAFQTQSWRDQGVSPASKAGSLAIVAALVNARNPEEGRETVTLFNRSDRVVDLGDWKIRDKSGRADVLHGVSIGAGDAARIRLTGQQARLGNDAGEIHLLAPDDTLVHAVSYGATSDPEGWSVLF
jgi:uncharacterized protein YukJ